MNRMTPIGAMLLAAQAHAAKRAETADDFGFPLTRASGLSPGRLSMLSRDCAKRQASYQFICC